MCNVVMYHVYTSEGHMGYGGMRRLAVLSFLFQEHITLQDGHVHVLSCNETLRIWVNYHLPLHLYLKPQGKLKISTIHTSCSDLLRIKLHVSNPRLGFS
ncbi:hypothetical protein GQ53DRAFT_139324 [Thozetella sp. PMI_491]|nr:hypothetical protein GQ53DRAFT_139324 [Thozetella sp. PMI_491]